MLQRFLEDLVVTWVVIDPIGTVPVFLTVTVGFDAAARRRVALRAILVSAGILLGFIVLGQLVLDLMQIPLSAFQVGGGIVLFLFAMSMIFGESKPEEECALKVEKERDVAIYPLAVPSIAGPGTITAAIVLTDNHRFSVSDQVLTTIAMMLVLAATLLLLRLAMPIHRLIGDSGASIVSRIMGLILAAAASDNVLSGIKQYFELG